MCDQLANANTVATEYVTSNPTLAMLDASDAMDAHTIKVETVFDNDDETTKKLSTKEFYSVIDELTNTIEMFPNNLTINNSYLITQDDIDNVFVIPTSKLYVVLIVF